MSVRPALPRLGESWQFAFLVVGLIAGSELVALARSAGCIHPYGYPFSTPLNITSEPRCPLCGARP